jgi:hypothetical protein
LGSSGKREGRERDGYSERELKREIKKKKKEKNETKAKKTTTK